MQNLYTGLIMTIFKTAFDTTVGSSFNKDKLIHFIKEGIIKDNLEYESGELTKSLDIKPILLTGRSNSEKVIPSFAHPIYFEYNNTKYLCGDVRNYVRIADSNFVIKNTAEFNLMNTRVALNLIWLLNRPEMLRDFSFVSGAIFSNWISESLSRRFALDSKDQLSIGIIAHLYYQSLFTPLSEFSEEDKQKMAVSCIKATRAPSKMVFDIIDKIVKLNNLADFCDTCITVLENIRIQDMNSGILITILGNSWFGTNAKEVVAISLEHPPTWICLVYAALTERGYRNSVISKLSDRYSGSKGGSDYIKSFVHLYQSVVTNNDSVDDNNF